MSAEATQAGDNAELEDLFDSIAAAPQTALSAPATVTPLRPVAVAPADTSGDADSDELEDLFDSIAMAKLTPAQAAASDMTQPLASVEAPGVHAAREADPQADASAATKVINSVGHLTRQLHDTLVELGYDRHLQDAAAAALPDARQRIAYVVTLTEQAASRSLNAVELATPIQERLATTAESLAGNWDRVFRGESDVTQFKALAASTRDYLKDVPVQAQATREHLREVMMAQEFQDLTGQVLKRITELANNLETQLLKLLVENSPTPVKNSEALGLLNGPQIGGAAPDVVADQAQVDELLESLGF
jgi:chemotaxis protein CheZ